MAMVGGHKILSFETAGSPWPRVWAVPERKCINPGCEILTRSEGGQCAVCTVIQRAEERIARGDVQSTKTNAICAECLEPYNKTSKGSLCPVCRIRIYKKNGGRKDILERAERELAAEGSGLC